MTIFNTIQFPAFDGTTKVAQPALPQFSMPDDEAIRVFQQTYERPTELPQTMERPAELPPATPETLAKVVEENLTLAKNLLPPVELPHVVEKQFVAGQLTTPVAAPVAVERPVVLPEATPETLAKVVEENLTLAKNLLPPVELPHVVEKQFVVGQLTTPVAAPVAVERPVVLPEATPETLAKVVEENLTLAKELPAATPETLAKVVGENLTLAKELPEATPETLVKVVEENLTLAKELPEATPETLAKVVGENLTLAKELPTVTPETLAKVVEENLTLAKELPTATPETLAKVVGENLTLAKELPKPVEVPGKPTVATPVRKVANDTDPVPQALPETVVGSAPAVAPAVNVQEPAPVAGVAAKVSAEMPRTASSVVIEAASAVADTLLVTPHLMHGGGEIRVQLKPDVLDGAQICIKVMGKSMQVEFSSVTDDVARLMTEAQPQLVRRLAEKIPTFEVAVTVLPGNAAGRRLARKGVGHPGGEA